ncbi:MULTISPECIES: hypothetical protein [Streptomyces]|uniref:hypothetical protein n=1 Tax=Streptomyces TaxID=1883 RepID=UPI000F784A93|nr:MULTISPECIES: hypothetical protein [Streptomyces]RST08286.1 hypothetical protein EF910_03070 [Streptomyces sp. WAC07149]GLX20853.1 hypothetical protein Slala01_44970 [Streptomyces lavendulae subsp. lavendulae]GLX31872.1 hypothetical protein Slala02_76910 [Streptomyces lavendulae subsp. lavendulae]
MSTQSIWRAVARQAEVWARLAVVQEFAARLPRNTSGTSAGVRGRLQRMQAGGMNIGGKPLRAGSSVRYARAIPFPGVEDDCSEGDWTAWVRTADRVEAAHRQTIAWLRSRLPGYPMIPAPQISADTALATTEFTYRLGWHPQERAAGFQFRSCPPTAASILGADRQQEQALAETARQMSTALMGSPEWSRLARAREALDGEARAALGAARTRLRRRLSPEALDACEPALAVKRDQYRRVVLSEELEALSGPAREYADAFDGADLLVETAASDVFGQLALYGAVTRLAGIRDVDLDPGQSRSVHFSVDDEIWMVPGQLVRLDDDLITEVVRLTEVSLSLTPADGARLRVTGEILPGSDEAQIV